MANSYSLFATHCSRNLTCRVCRALSGSGRRGSFRLWRAFRTSRRFRRSLLRARCGPCRDTCRCIRGSRPRSPKKVLIASGRSAHRSPDRRRLREFEMSMGMAGFAFRGGAEHGGDIVVAFDVGLLREIEIAAVGLAFAREGSFRLSCGLAAFQGCHGVLLVKRILRRPEAARARECSLGNLKSTV